MYVELSLVLVKANSAVWSKSDWHVARMRGLVYHRIYTGIFVTARYHESCS